MKVKHIQIKLFESNESQMYSTKLTESNESQTLSTKLLESNESQININKAF